MSAEQTPDIERVLAEHSTVATGLGEWCCKCSPTTWRPTVHRAPHVAQALAPVLAAAVREALREAADEAEALKTFAHGNNPVSQAHVTGFGTARRLIVRQLRDRADRVAEPQHEAATSGGEGGDE